MLTKEKLKELGVEEATIQKVLDAQTESMKGYVTRARLDEVTTEKDGLKEQLKARDKDIADLKKTSGSAEELQTKLTEMETKYKAETETLQTQLNEQKLNSALDMALINSKARNPKAVRGLLDMSKLKLKDDGTLEGLDIEGLQKSDPYLFETTDGTKGPSFSGVKPLGGSDSGTSSTSTIEAEMDSILGLN